MEQELGLGCGPPCGASTARLAQSWREGEGSRIVQPPAWGSRVWHVNHRPGLPSMGSTGGQSEITIHSLPGAVEPSKARGGAGQNERHVVPVILC